MRHAIMAAAVCALVVATGTLAFRVRSASGLSPWGPYEADINRDRKVNSTDMLIVAQNFGKRVPTATFTVVPTATPTSYCDFSGRTFPLLQLVYNGGGVLAGQPGFPPTGGFSDCKFVGMTASGNLAMATFRRSDFTNASIRNSQFTRADFEDAVFINADLSDGVFWGASFVNANLTNANLSETDASGYYFEGAVFTGAITTGANVTGVIWNNTTCPDGTNSDNNGGSCIGHGFAGTPLPTWTPMPTSTATATPTDTPTATATPLPCVGGDANAVWTAGNSQCYQRFDALLSFSGARLDCESRGDHLVTITDQAEQDFVWSSLGPVNALIGFTDEAVEGTWVWVTGEPVGYTNWRAGEPNNGLGGPVEHAAQLTVIGGGGWNDLPVEEAFPYICESL